MALMSTLGDADPHPHKHKQVPQQPLNTDNRTCKDIITSLGFVPDTVFRFNLVINGLLVMLYICVAQGPDSPTEATLNVIHIVDYKQGHL